MWSLVTAASTFPVTLAEAMLHVRSDLDEDEPLVTGLIAAANDVIGQMVGFPLGVEEWAAILIGKDPVSVPLYPVAELVSVGDDLDGFALVRDGDSASITGPWPADAVTVTVKVGGFVPPALKQAMLLLLGHWMENRETASDKPQTELPFAVESLVSLYRRGWAKA